MLLHWDNLLRGALGMFFLIFVCFLLSNNKRAINWRLVLIGIFAQVMFAMGVLHTTIFGQPVFWMLFGIILVYTIVRKYKKIRSGDTTVNYDGQSMLVSIFWQVLLVIGLVFAASIFKQWSSLAITISTFLIIAFAFKMGNRHAELMKWNILFSSLVITLCVYFKVCPPDIFRIVLQSTSNVFVDLIDISHKGTEFLFGKLADSRENWAYVFAIQVLPNIIFFAALSAILFYLGILQKIVFVFAIPPIIIHRISDLVILSR